MKKNILILGSGGREHALCLKISASPLVEKIYYASGILHDDFIPNPAMHALAQHIPLNIASPDDVVTFCKSDQIDFVVVGPEAPIVAGVCDALITHDIPHFGPTKQAGQLESSKSFTKDICKILNVPTATYETYHNAESAITGLSQFSYPVVIKADGLAAGKGVVIAEHYDDAIHAIHEMFDGKFGDAGQKIVLEAFLTGQEASFFVLCDGENIIPLTSAQDHKRVFDGDKGENTGGMGAYSPAPVMNELVTKRTIDMIIRPIVDYMKQNNMPFRGVLYAGLMIDNDMPSLIEFNARFGDPETQVLMLRLQSDILPLLMGCYTGFDNVPAPIWHDNHAITVVMASRGYPEKPKTGGHIILPDEIPDNVIIHHAGTILKDDKIVSNGGRVLNITAAATTLSDAQKSAYNTIKQIDFADGFYRHDIGYRAL
jgi:phosphoribosylamine---glycine ligase